MAGLFQTAAERKHEESWASKTKSELEVEIKRLRTQLLELKVDASHVRAAVWASRGAGCRAKSQESCANEIMQLQECVDTEMVKLRAESAGGGASEEAEDVEIVPAGFEING